MNDISFGDLFTSIRNGLSIKQDKSGHGLPISRIETISNGIIDPSRVGYAGIQLKDGRDWFLQSGDLLFSHINSVEHIGKCAVYRDIPAQLVHGMNLLCLRPNKDRLDSNYAQWLIRSSGFRSRLSNFINKAVNQASVSTTNLRSIRVSVPPVNEQRRIATILDQADALRAKRRQALSKLDTLTQSLFLEMFGDPMTNPRGWPMVSVAEIGEVVTGSTPSRTKTEYFGKEIEWIKSDNINTPHYYVTKATEYLSELGKSVARIVPPKSILVTCIAGSPGCIGNAAMTDREVAFNQQINALVPREGDPHFIYALMLAAKRKIQEASTKGMKGIVTKSRFEHIRLPFPPVTLQQKYAQRVSGMRTLTTTSRAGLDCLDSLGASLQYRAFRGEL